MSHIKVGGAQRRHRHWAGVPLLIMRVASLNGGFLMLQAVTGLGMSPLFAAGAESTLGSGTIVASQLRTLLKLRFTRVVLWALAAFVALTLGANVANAIAASRADNATYQVLLLVGLVVVTAIAFLRRHWHWGVVLSTVITLLGAVGFVWATREESTHVTPLGAVASLGVGAAYAGRSVLSKRLERLLPEEVCGLIRQLGTVVGAAGLAGYAFAVGGIGHLHVPQEFSLPIVGSVTVPSAGSAITVFVIVLSALILCGLLDTGWPQALEVRALRMGWQPLHVSTSGCLGPIIGLVLRLLLAGGEVHPHVWGLALLVTIGAGFTARIVK